jgi:hypothetical protein
MNGKKVFIYVDNALVAGTVIDKISADCNIIPTASQDNGEWDSNEAGRKSWSFASSWLMTNGDSITRVLMIGTTVQIVVKVDEPGTGVTNKLYGTAIVKSCEIEARVGSLVNGNFLFVGSGALTTTAPSNISDNQ